MQFIKETFLNLEPVAKSDRPKIDGYSDLHLKQNKNGYAFQLKYLSPKIGKRRFFTFVSFKYGDNVLMKMIGEGWKGLYDIVPDLHLHWRE